MISSKGSKQRVGGYAHWFNGDIGVPDREQDTCQCSHCGNVFYVDPFQQASDAGGWCMLCTKVICKDCVDVGECRPFEKQLDKHEAMERRRNANNGIYR